MAIGHMLLILFILLSSLTQLSAAQQKAKGKNSNTTKTEPPSTVPYWNYSSIADWPSQFPLCGQGRRQSPIYLSPLDTYYDIELDLDPLHYVNYVNKTVSYPGYLSNDGRIIKWTLQADREKRALPRISGGELGAWFILHHIDFHWGDYQQADKGCGRRGSEHTLGEEFLSTPLEVHLVHYNERYKTYERAIDKSDGLAIVAFLVEKGPAAKSFDADYSDFSNKTTSISQESYFSEPLIYVNLGKLLPFESWESQKNTSQTNNNTVNPQRPTASYYRYAGSITSPPCYESVTWTVYSKMVLIDPEQVRSFMTGFFAKTMLGTGEAEMVNNYRPIQKSNSRYVTTNSRQLASANRATTLIKPANYSVISILPMLVLAIFSNRF